MCVSLCVQGWKQKHLLLTVAIFVFHCGPVLLVFCLSATIDCLDTCSLPYQRYHLWLFGVQRGFIFHMVCFLAWSLNVASHIYTDSIDSGMCDHVSSFVCNLGVECELTMMKGVSSQSLALVYFGEVKKKPPGS
jgi:hypothetical protein